MKLTADGICSGRRHEASYFSSMQGGGGPYFTFPSSRSCLSSSPLSLPTFLRVEAIIQRTPIGRWADADEVSGLVAFLCMRGAGYITSQIIATDGGFTANGWMT